MEISRECVIILSLTQVTAELTRRQLNVLVDSVEDSPVALIADFGVAMVVRNVDSMQIQRDTRQDMFSPQWSALEVLNGENPTKESDVYSLAMVAIEVGHG